MKFLLLVQALSLLDTCLSVCTSSSVYVSGADGFLGFGGGAAIALDGCYSLVSGTGEFYCKNGAYDDGPCLVGLFPGWVLAQYEAEYVFDGRGDILSPVGATIMWSYEDEHPADVEGWFNGVHLDEEGHGPIIPENTVCVTCGCSVVPQCTPVSPTPEPVSPTPEPASPTPSVIPDSSNEDPSAPTPSTFPGGDDTSGDTSSSRSSSSTGAIVGGSVVASACWHSLLGVW